MEDRLKNPIISGYYPDPSICRAGKDFYLVCSSFEMFPGLPVFHSRDLVHWEQIGNAMTAENGFQVEKGSGVCGLMAPTIRHYNGTFYIINANFSDKGNYIIHAKDPAGPWSQPHWLTDVPGIDASIFFDHDGTAYIMGTGKVWDNGAGEMERGIWLARYDIENYKMLSEPVTIFNSALRGGSSPEAPHIYHIGDWYYLIIAEGGTEHHHAVMVARSKTVDGFYQGNPANPVLTHRNMGYTCPIINVGHADLVELEDGSWYAVMLASRLIDGKYKNLGRETFICPVLWERDWPLFSPETGRVEWSYDAPPSLPQVRYPLVSEREDFDRGDLPMNMVLWGTPQADTYRIEDSRLKLRCIPQALADDMFQAVMDGVFHPERHVAFVGRRQCAVHSYIATAMHFLPQGGESAGLAVVQAMNHQLHVERAIEDGRQVLRTILYTADYDGPPYFPGFSSITHRTVLNSVPWEKENIVLAMDLNGEEFTVYYGNSRDCLKELCRVDGGLINPEKVGCMCGTLLGMFATSNHTGSLNAAEFDWFVCRE